jgi:hypothetical protein
MNTRREERKRAAIEKQIDEKTQQIPDRFLQLLDKLREQE